MGAGELLAGVERSGAGEGATFTTVVSDFLRASAKPSAPATITATRVTSICFPFPPGSRAGSCNLAGRTSRRFELLDPINGYASPNRRNTLRKVTSRTFAIPRWANGDATSCQEDDPNPGTEQVHNSRRIFLQTPIRFIHISDRVVPEPASAPD